jgi:Nucleotidyl transferase AbiEii toxin, Type IV TA system
MNTLLGMDANRRRQVFEQTAAQMDLAAVSVEKDFWVCWTLDKLFRMPCGQFLTFKGGTSLSKAWKLIERFSEDIDITIHRDALGFGGDNAPHVAPSKSQRKKRLDALQAACEQYIAGPLLTELHTAITSDLPEHSVWTLKPDIEDNQTLLFEYPSVFPTQAEYLRRWVQIEMGGRADVDPAANVTIQPYVAEVFPDLLSDANARVRAILPVRTFWEKAMLLHEESFRPADKQRKTSLARHYYDLYRMILAGVADQAVADLELFHRIANQREMYFQYTWVDYSTYIPGQLHIVPVEVQLKVWQADYSNMQAEMFFGEVPGFEEILEAVRQFQDRFNRVAD